MIQRPEVIWVFLQSFFRLLYAAPPLPDAIVDPAGFFVGVRQLSLHGEHSVLFLRRSPYPVDRLFEIECLHGVQHEAEVELEVRDSWVVRDSLLHEFQRGREVAAVGALRGVHEVKGQMP